MSSTAIFAALVAVNAVTTTAGLVLYYKRRNCQPIRERGPYMVIIRSIGTLALSLFTGIALMNPSSMLCLAYVPVNVLFETLTIGSVVLNLFVLQVDMALKFNAQVSGSSSRSDMSLQKMFQKRNKFNPAYNLTLLVWMSVGACIAAIVGVAALSDGQLRPQMVSDNLCTIKGQTAFTWYIILAIAYFALTLWEVKSIYSLWESKEKYYLRHEIAPLVVLTAVKGVFFILHGSGSFIDQQKEFNLAGIVNWQAFGIAHTLTTLFFPCWLSYTSEFRSDGDDMGAKRKTRTKKKEVDLELNTNVNQELLARILSNPQSKKLFHDFLAEEFALENLRFYEAAQDFKEKYSGEKISRLAMIEDAVSLYDQYIDVHSPLCVNISAPTRKELAKQIKGEKIVYRPSRKAAGDQENSKAGGKGILNNKVFDKAAQEIFNLMSLDTFNRFKNSPAFAQISKELHISRDMSVRDSSIRTPTSGDQHMSFPV